MAARASRGGMPHDGHMTRWTRRGSPLWGSATGLLRGLLLFVAIEGAFRYLEIQLATSKALGNGELADESSRPVLDISLVLIAGMLLVCIADFVSMRLTTLLSGIMLLLGLLMAMLPINEGTSWDELAAYAGPPAITLGLSLTVLWLYRTRCHDERAYPLPTRELMLAAAIGIGYGGFYTAIANPVGYPFIALASLFMLLWWQRFAVWIAVFTAVTGVRGLVTAIAEGPPERLVHRLPWAIAVLAMVPLAQRGVRKLTASPSPPPGSSDGVTLNPDDLPGTTTPTGDLALTRDARQAQGRHDGSTPKDLSGSSVHEGADPGVSRTPSASDSDQQTPPARKDTPSAVADPLRWFGRPDRYKRAGDRSNGTRADT